MEAVDAPVVDAVVDETVGVWLVDVVTVDATVVDAAGTVVGGAVDVGPVVDVSAATELQTFPNDVASAAGQLVSQFDRLLQVPASSEHAALVAVVAAPSGVASGAAQGLAVSSGAEDDRDGVSVAPAAAASCKCFLPDAAQAGLQCAVGVLGVNVAPLAGSAQMVLEEDSGLLWVEQLGS